MMSDYLSEQQPPAGQVSKPKRRASSAWLWGLLAFLFIFVMPVIGCGICGFTFALASTGSNQPTLGPTVAIIHVEGIIYPGRSADLGGSVVGSDTIVSLIEQARKDDNIKAVVLRVDSPGGDVVASDEIHHALQRLNKPIVVSMGSLAASGGYYISVPADYIYATPHTLTGSIGVISQFVTAQELLDDIGVEVVVITAGEVKDFGSYYRNMTDDEVAYWQALIDETHEAFIEVVAQGRGMDVDTVRDLADGRVYTGQQALALGLVDGVGYFDDALVKAAELGGISGEPNIVELKPEIGFWESLYGFQAQQPLPFSLDILREMVTPSLEFRYMGP